MKVCLDLHDFSGVNNRLGMLKRLREFFPNFKVSLFTVPLDRKCDWGPWLVREQSLKEIRKCLDWMQIIPHGLTHESNVEMLKYGYDNFKGVVMPTIEKAFKDDGLPFVKGFCAPHWRWSDGVVEALDEAGWWGAVLREDKMKKTKKFYRYTHLLNEPFWTADLPVLKLHGHIYGTKNDVGECFQNLLKLPKNVEWVYATELLEEKE